MMFSYINSINFWFNGKSKVKSLPNLEVSPNASNSGVLNCSPATFAIYLSADKIVFTPCAVSFAIVALKFFVRGLDCSVGITPK